MKTSPHGVERAKLEQPPLKPPSTKPDGESSSSGLLGPREESGLRFPMARMEHSVGEHWAGEVVRAVLPGARDPVQVLAIGAEVAPTRKAVERCVAAGRGTAKVRGPAVARFVELLRLEDGRLGLATEPVEGQSLAKALGDGSMQLGRAVGVLRQLAHAMRTAEKARLSHGALCIDTIWLTRRDERDDAVVIADFGLEAIMEPHLQDDQFDAPQRPYSPERLLGLDRAHEDVYLFGCIAHHILAGRPPFAGARGEDLRRSHSIEDVPPIRRIVTGLPGPIAVIVDRCLANDSNERYPDFGEVEAALCMAQIDTGLRTPWDDLPLPAIPASSRKKAEQFFGPSRAREIVAVGVSSSAASPGDDDVTAPRPAVPASLRAASSIPVPAAAPDGSESRPGEENAPLPDASLPTGAAGPVTASDPDDRGGFPLWIPIAGGVTIVAALLVGIPMLRAAPEPDSVAQRDELEPAGASVHAEEPPPTTADGEPDQSADSELPGTEQASLAAVGDTDGVVPPANGGAGAEDEARAGGADEAAPMATADSDDPVPVEHTDGPIVGHGPSRGGEDGDGEPADEAHDNAENATSAQSVASLLASASSAQKAGKTSRAVKLYKQVLGKDPKNRQALPALGDLYFNRSDYSNAAKYFKKAVAASPGSASHRLSLGDAYYKLGRYPDAKAQYEKAKSLGSGSATKRIDKVNKKLGG